MATIEDLKNSVVNGKRKEVNAILPELLEAGNDPETILNDGLIAAMAIVGERFKNGEIFVPEMLVSARAMKAGLAHIEPKLQEAGVKPEFKVLIGTVAGDLHDIGKNLVAIMWKGAGFDVVDLGVDVPKETFVEAVKEHQPHLVGLSALLTTTMPAMKETVEALRAEFGGDLKILVGGAPVSQSFSDEITASGYARDAGEAVEVALKLVKG